MKKTTLCPEPLEARRLMAVIPYVSPAVPAGPVALPAAEVAPPQGPVTAAPLALPAISLGTMSEDGSLLVQKARLLAGVRGVVPGAVDVQNLVIVRGSGTLTPQAGGSWLFRPTANWFGEVEFSYTIIVRDSAGYRTIDGIDPASFTSPVQNGSARVTPRGLVLTTAGYQKGSAYLAQKIDLTRDFSTTFRLGLSGGTGGDGVAFVIHNDRRGATTLGDGTGYYGIRPSVGVEFDTYVGGNAADAVVGMDHVGMLLDGGEVMSQQAFPGFDLRSGPFTAWVDYKAATSTLEVFVSRFDAKPAVPMFTMVRNLASTIGREGFFGFTGSTGYYTDVQVVEAWVVRGWTSGNTTVRGTATLTVRGVNDAPVVSGPVNLGVAFSGQSVRITAAQLLANARDVDGDPLAVRNLRVSAGAQLRANGDGSWTFTATVRQATSFTFTYDVTDGRSSVRASAGIIVQDVIVLPNPPLDPRPIPVPMPTPVAFASLASSPVGSVPKRR